MIKMDTKRIEKKKEKRKRKKVFAQPIKIKSCLSLFP